MSFPRFFTKRIYLDTLFSRRVKSPSDHWVGASFKSFAVLRCSDPNYKFSLKLTPDATSGDIQGIPLRTGYFHNFATLPNDAVFENDAVQPGIWVDILISTQDELTANPVDSERSAISTVELGHARGELDGLTRQVTWAWQFDDGMSNVKDIGNPKLNNGSFTNNLGIRNNQFKVPVGYQGEIIGCVVTFSIVPDPFLVPLQIFAISTGSTYAETTISDNYKLGYIYSPNDPAPSSGDYNVRPVVDAVAGEYGYEREGLFLNAGEIPIVAAKTAMWSQGLISGYFLIRLKRVE